MPESAVAFDAETLRADFPILARSVNDHPLAYLDNAASTQMPNAVIDRIVAYQRGEHANVHRGVHTLSQNATLAYEGARETVRRFLNAPSTEEIIFTRGTTEGINLVATCFGRMNVSAGDEVLISALEHHANLVPWQVLCEDVGAKLVVAPIDDAGNLDAEALIALITPRTRIVAVTQVSNALGTVVDVKRIIDAAHAVDVPVLIDGAQAVLHMPIDLQALDADFYVFSGHKVCGPTGIGALFGKRKFLDKMRPWQYGGDMIRLVSYEKTTFNDLPYKFEAGTPAIMAAIGLGAALDYVSAIGVARIGAYEQTLLQQATRLLSARAGVRLIGTAAHKAAVLSFEVEGVHPHDVGSILDAEGVAIRAGHHCAQPLMKRLGVPATARASFAFYNTPAEVEALDRAIGTVQEIFG